MAWNQGEFQLSAQFGTREVETHTLLCERIWNVSKLGASASSGRAGPRGHTTGSGACR
jgi:hypothetical protein